jgi:hypothetical protein
MATTAKVGPQASRGPLSPDELARLDAWWRAANYLSVGQIYLLDNPLLREPLRLEHVKPRLLGHWVPCGPVPAANPTASSPTRACWPSTSTRSPRPWPASRRRPPPARPLHDPPRPGRLDTGPGIGAPLVAAII